MLQAKDNDVKKTNTRIDDLKEAEVKRLLFDPVLNVLNPPKPRATKAKAPPAAVLDKLPDRIHWRRPWKNPRGAESRL